MESSDGRRYALYAAGSNAEGQLGTGHVKDAHLWERCRHAPASAAAAAAPADDHFPPTGSRVIALSSGAAHTVCIVVTQQAQSHQNRSERQVWACGSGEQGQLGPAYVGTTLTSFQQIDVAQQNDDDGEGDDDDCRGGIDTRRVVDVECGWDWTLLLLEGEKVDDEQSLVVLGRNNDFGQLGIGQRARGKTKCVAKVDILRSLNREVDLSSAQTRRWSVKKIQSGVRHTLVLCRALNGHGGSVYAVVGWGATRQGQVVERRDAQGKNVAVLWEPECIAVWQADATAYDPGDVRLSVGKEHSAIRVPLHWRIVRQSFSSDRTFSAVHLFGSDKQGQTSFPQRTIDMLAASDVLSVVCTWNSTLIAARKPDDSSIVVVGAGSNSKGQLGAEKDVASIDVPTMQADTARLVRGSEHVVLLLSRQTTTSENVVLGWGWNEHGNLAQGDTKDRRSPITMWPTPASTYDGRATDVFAGCGTTFVQTVER